MSHPESCWCFGRGAISFGEEVNWFTAGSVLCVAADLDGGKMLVFSSDGSMGASGDSEWRTVHEVGLRPGEAVGVGLFPAVSGKDGARIRCSFGNLRFAPPSGGFVAVGDSGTGSMQVLRCNACVALEECRFRFLDLVDSVKSVCRGKIK